MAKTKKKTTTKRKAKVTRKTAKKARVVRKKTSKQRKAAVTRTTRKTRKPVKKAVRKRTTRKKPAKKLSTTQRKVKRILALERRIDKLTDEIVGIRNSLGKSGYCFYCRKNYSAKKCEVAIVDGEGLIVEYGIMCPENHIMAKITVDER
jgi:hypothetical protein